MERIAPAAPDGRQVAIDLGTSHTVGVVREVDGRVRSLLFDSSPLLPSAVYAEPGTGALRVGVAAARMAAVDPGGLEPNPKLRIDETSVLLSGRDVPVVDMF